MKLSLPIERASGSPWSSACPSSGRACGYGSAACVVVSLHAALRTRFPFADADDVEDQKQEEPGEEEDRAAVAGTEAVEDGEPAAAPVEADCRKRRWLDAGATAAQDAEADFLTFVVEPAALAAGAKAEMQDVRDTAAAVEPWEVMGCGGGRGRGRGRGSPARRGGCGRRRLRWRGAERRGVGGGWGGGTPPSLPLSAPPPSSLPSCAVPRRGGERLRCQAAASFLRDGNERIRGAASGGGAGRSGPASTWPLTAFRADIPMVCGV